MRRSSARCNHLVGVTGEHHPAARGLLIRLLARDALFRKRQAFLNGEYRRFGWVSFFPYCFAYKTPLALFVLLGAGSGGCVAVPKSRRIDVVATRLPIKFCARRQATGNLLYEMVPLVALFVVYWAFALSSHLNIGHRHLLPTYPALFIVAGAAAWWIRPPKFRAPMDVTNCRHSCRFNRTCRQHDPRRAVPLLRWITIAALAVVRGRRAMDLAALSGVLQSAGRRPMERLSASGRQPARLSQDLKETKAWLDAHPDDARDPERLYFAFYGSPPFSYYGIKARALPSFPEIWQPHIPQPLTGGTYLISATVLHGVVIPTPGRWNEQVRTAAANPAAKCERLSGICRHRPRDASAC